MRGAALGAAGWMSLPGWPGSQGVMGRFDTQDGWIDGCNMTLSTFKFPQAFIKVWPEYSLLACLREAQPFFSVDALCPHLLASSFIF